MAVSRTIRLAVGLVAGVTLALQVLLTRLLAAAISYQFDFMAISLALLGAGAGAIAVYLRPGWFAAAGRLPAALSRYAIALVVLLALVPLGLVRIHFGTGTAVTGTFTAQLALVCVLSVLPFTAAGILIALAVRASSARLGPLYAWDLAGAGIGAVAVVPLMWVVGVPTLLAGLTLPAALAALALAWEAGPRLRAPALTAAAVAVLAVALAATTSLYRQPPNNPVHALTPVADHWTPLNRVVGYAPPRGSGFGLVFYDRVYAPVPVYQRGRPLPDWRALHLGPQTIAYRLTGPGRALVIGGGGGRDIENALSSGARRVDVIELNRRIISTVDDDLGRWSGSPYTLPGVHTVAGDGRATLAHRSTRYDVIHIGFTDTLSANSAQAFGLTEANLYTTQAVREYLDHLTPNGILDLSRPYHLVGDEALRATILVLQALRDQGVAHPERNVVVVLGYDLFGELFGTVLAQRHPFSPAQLAQIRTLARQRGAGVAFAPGGPYFAEWRQLAAAPTLGAFCTHFRFDVCAPTDDRPFFFNMKRLSDIGRPTPAGYTYAVDPLVVLLITLGILAAMGVLSLVLPLLGRRGAPRPGAGSLLYFGAIGLGYLVLEIVLIQRFVLFLGFPTYALSVVLLALLVFTGIGALLSDRVRDARLGLTVALAVGIALIVACAAGLEPLLRALISVPFAGRVALCVAMLAPLGLTLGMAMPLGLGRLSALEPEGVPWAWGINGIMSVLGSALGVLVAIAVGFSWATGLAGACYAVALAQALLGRWPRGAAAEVNGAATVAVVGGAGVPAGAVRQ